MKYIFVDFEMNPIAKEFKAERKICGREIIEIGAVMLDASLTEVQSYKSYVKPEYNKEVYKKFEELTGVSTAMTAGASTFEEAIRKFAAWCGQDEYEVYAWSNSDLEQVRKEMQLKKIELTEELQYMCEHWIDFQKVVMDMAKVDKLLSLEKALNCCGISFSGRKHDALYDARNTSRLFVESRTSDLTKSINYIKDYLAKEEEKVTLGDMFNFSMLGLQAP